MGKRDYRQREQKKPKKAEKAVTKVEVLAPSPMSVEVVGKGNRKKRDQE